MTAWRESHVPGLDISYTSWVENTYRSSMQTSEMPVCDNAYITVTIFLYFF